jgi:hypothetical protein
MAARARATEHPSRQSRFAPHASADEKQRRSEKSMIYELRTYRCVPGRQSAVLSRFEKHILRIWDKHGIRQAGFWTTLIGQSNQEIIYMLAWDSMAEREKRWRAFLADPEWIAIATETEKGGPIVDNISNQLLAPAAFSAVK